MKMYEQAAQAQQGAESAEGQGNSDDDVVDAEYTEVNDEDKKQ